MYEFVKQLVQLIGMVLPSLGTAQMSESAQQKWMALYELHMPVPQDAPSADGSPMSLLTPEVFEKFGSFFSEDQLSAVKTQLAELTASWETTPIPVMMMNIRSDPKFLSFIETLQNLFGSKTDAEKAQMKEIFLQESSFLAHMQGAGAAATGGGSSDLSSMFTRGAEAMTRPDIDDSDPLQLSERDFALLKHESLQNRQ